MLLCVIALVLSICLMLFLLFSGVMGPQRNRSPRIRTPGRNKKPNRTGRTEPNRLIPEPAGTGLGTEPKRTGPSHDGSEKRRPNRVEPGQNTFQDRSEPNRLIFEKFGTETNRTELVPSWNALSGGAERSPINANR